MKVVSYLAILVLTILTGCMSANTKQLYAGEPLPKEQTALINGSYQTSYPFNIDVYVNLSCVDGKKLLGWNNNLALLPGKHKFIVDWRISDYYFGEFRYGETALNVDLKPNQVYKLESVRKNREYHVAITNKETGEVVTEQLVQKRFPGDYSTPEYPVTACEDETQTKKPYVE